MCFVEISNHKAFALLSAAEKKKNNKDTNKNKKGKKSGKKNQPNTQPKSSSPAERTPPGNKRKRKSEGVEESNATKKSKVEETEGGETQTLLDSAYCIYFQDHIVLLYVR